MRARSRRTNWWEWMTGVAGEQLHARKRHVVERQVARSSARGWQWQGRQLGGVVVVASQLLPQEGHQVAKLEHTNVSSKLQCSLSCYKQLLLLRSTLYLMHSLFEDRNIELYIPLEYALNIIHMEPCQSLKLWNAEFDSEITNWNTQSAVQQHHFPWHRHSPNNPPLCSTSYRNIAHVDKSKKWQKWPPYMNWTKIWH
jgi:hypothetical protein